MLEVRKVPLWRDEDRGVDVTTGCLDLSVTLFLNFFGFTFSHDAFQSVFLKTLFLLERE